MGVCTIAPARGLVRCPRGRPPLPPAAALAGAAGGERVPSLLHRGDRRPGPYRPRAADAAVQDAPAPPGTGLRLPTDRGRDPDGAPHAGAREVRSRAAGAKPDRDDAAGP